MAISYLTFDQYQELKEKAIIIDVRTKEEFNLLKKIDGSINIYINDLLSKPENHLSDYDAIIITVCNAGNRSSQAAHSLKEFGYKNVHILDGGIYRYLKQIEQLND